MMSSLCSVLHWNLGHQNGMSTISAYLKLMKSTLEAAKPLRIDLCNRFSSHEWYHVWSMHCVASLFNPENEALFYKGCSVIDPENVCSIDDIIGYGMDQWQLLMPTHIPQCLAVPSGFDIHSINQIVFLEIDMELSESNQAQYRTVLREKPAGTRWWKFDMQSMVQPFQLLSTNDKKLWHKASVAYFFSAPRPDSVSRNVINSAISLRFRTRISQVLATKRVHVDTNLSAYSQDTVSDVVSELDISSNEGALADISSLADDSSFEHDSSCDESDLLQHQVTGVDPAMDANCRFIQDGKFETIKRHCEVIC